MLKKNIETLFAIKYFWFLTLCFRDRLKLLVERFYKKERKVQKLRFVGCFKYLSVRRNKNNQKFWVGNISIIGIYLQQFVKYKWGRKN